MGRIKDFYTMVAEQAGLDPTEPKTIELVAEAIDASRGAGELDDVFDEAVDRLLVSHGCIAIA